MLRKTVIQAFLSLLGCLCVTSCLLTRDAIYGPLYIDNYLRNGRPLDTVTVNYTLSTEDWGESLCQVDPVTFSEDQLSARLRGETFLILTIRCQERLLVDTMVTKQTQRLAKIVFAYALITNCVISLDFLLSLTVMYKVYGIVLTDTVLFSDSDLRKFSSPLRMITLRPETYPLTIEAIPMDGFVYESVSGLGFLGLNLTQVPENLTSSFPNLQILAVGDNHLETVPDIRFLNSIYTLPDNVTQSKHYRDNAQYVSELNIPPNRIPKVLDLQMNFISSIEEDSFSGHFDLITLNRNKIMNISINAFRQTIGLSTLHLDNNLLRKLHLGMFTGLENLTYLHLSHNLIEHIDDRTFSNLVNLRLLNLDSNLLTTLNNVHLKGLRRLKLLTLQDNRILTIPHSTFLSSPSLSNLNLASNPLQEIPSSTLYLKNLEVIDLSSTGLHLDSLIQLISETPTLRITDYRIRKHRLHILFQKNNITSVYNLTVSNLIDKGRNIGEKSLLALGTFCLDVSNNPLSCDCVLAELLSFFQFVPHDLDELLPSWELCWEGWNCQSPREFQNKSIFTLQPSRLYCPEKVENCPTGCECSKRYKSAGMVINCEDQLFTEMPEYLPEGLLDVRITNNLLKTIHLRQYLHNVERLHLSYNSISEIPPSFSTYCRNLTHLYLDNNLLADFPIFLKELNLTETSLRHNRFVCTCDNLWFQTWLLQNKDIVTDWQEVSCSLSTGAVLSVLAVTSEDLGCSQYSILVIVVCLGIVFLLLTFLIISLVYFHQEISILWFIYRTKQNSHLRKTANLSSVVLVVFAEDDRLWVLTKVVQPLLSHFPEATLSIRFDSFIAGKSMKDNIDESLSTCASVIFILTQALLNDHWCGFILNQAFALSVENKVNFITLVKKENLAIHDIENDFLQNYFRLKRYICPQTKLFTQKLIYSVYKGVGLAFEDKTRLTSFREDQQSYPPMPVTDHGKKMCTQTFGYDVGLLYGDEERAWVIRCLLRYLETDGYKVCLPDRDDIYVPGGADKDNILRLFQACQSVILIASNKFMATERGLFAFRYATANLMSYEHSFVLVLSEELSNKSSPFDVVTYLKTHVCLRKADPIFTKKLRQFLSNSLQI